MWWISSDSSCPLAKCNRSKSIFLAGIIKKACATTPISTRMRRKTANNDIRVEPQLAEKVNAGCTGSECRRAVP
jgi:hypothetical protein